MNVDKCSACGRVVSGEDIDECRLCHAPLCVTCGVFKSGRLLCETCAEKVRDEELKEELDAGELRFGPSGWTSPVDKDIQK